MGKILVTGGSEFVGYYFQQKLDQERLVNLDLVAPRHETRTPFIHGDVCDKSSVLRALSPGDFDGIICLAAEHKDFGPSEGDYFRVNEHGTRMICEAASKSGVHQIVFFSSVAVYGPLEQPTTEATQPRPILPYGASKLAGERVLQDWVNQDPRRACLILRPTVIFGPRNRANMLRLIRQIDSGFYANVGGDNVKSIAYVENVVDATILLMERISPGFEIFNYVDDPQLTVREITGIIAQALGRQTPMRVPFALARTLALPFDLVIRATGKDLPVSTDRLQKVMKATVHQAPKLRALNFSPRFNSIDGLRRMVAWYVAEKKADRKPTVEVSSAG